MDNVLLVARLALFGIFLVAALTKLADKSGSRQMLIDFGVSPRLASLLAVLLPLAEFVIAVALIPLASVRLGVLAALSLLLAFTLAIAINLLRGRRPKCNCFGQLHSTRIGWWTFSRNGALAALAAVLFWRSKHDAGMSLLGWLGYITVAQLVGFFAAAIALALFVESVLLGQVLRQQGRMLLRLDSLHGFYADSSHGFVSGRVGLSSKAGLPVGTPAPRFALHGMDEQASSLDTLLAAGIPTLLIFTNPNCGPCRALLPEIAAWQRQYGSVLRIALITEGSKEDNRTKVAVLGREVLLLLQQKREVAEAYLAYGTPGAVLVQTDGTIATPLAQGAEEIRALVNQAGDGERTVAHVEPRSVHPTAQNGGGRTSRLQKPVANTGDLALALTFEDLNGKMVSVGSFRGADTLLLFWNPECGYCQQMLGELQSWEAKVRPGGPNLLVISTGTREANQAMALRSPVLRDEAFLAGTAFGANGTPSAVLLDATGRIASDNAAGAQAVFALANAKSLPRNESIL